MKDSTKLSWLRYSTYAGCFLMLFPSSVSWYWGNLRVYTDSYFRATLGPDSGFGTPWTVSLAVIGIPLGMSLSGYVAMFLSKGWTMAISCAVYNLAMCLSYFAVQKSVIFLSLTIGLMLGLGLGMIYGKVLEIIRDRCPSTKTGLIASAVTTAVGAGPLVIIQIITHFINPDNETPDLIEDENAFFTGEEILERVPKMCLVLLGLALSFHLVGFLLIMNPKYVQLLESNINQTMESKEGATCSTGYQEISKNINKRNLCSQISPHTKDCEPTLRCDNTTNHKMSSQNGKCDTAQSDSLLCKNGVHDHAAHRDDATGTGDSPSEIVENGSSIAASPQGNGQNISCGQKDKCPPEVLGERVQKEEVTSCKRRTENSKHLSPSQLLRNSTFYIMWLCVNCSDYCFILITNYYKTYGQLYIKDDHFLADLGTFIMIGFVCTRVLWGLMIDHLGVKNSFIVFSSGLCLGLSFWCFTVRVDKWLYVIWTVLLGIVNGGFNFIHSLGTLKMFGRTHFSRNFGLVIGGAIPLNLAGPPLIGLILQHWGYFVLVLIGAFLAAVNLTLVILFFPPTEID